MERLTKKSESGVVWFIDHENNDIRLEPCEMDSHNNRLAIEKLAEYEDLEEQGLLLKLPCKVGDKVYYTHPEQLDGKIEEYTVMGFRFNKQGCQISTFDHKGVIIYFYLEFIGKTVFLTQAEAEEALKGMGREE